MKKLPVYILIRTSGRPNFFKTMMASIKTQTYPNIITIVHTDDPKDKYVEGDIIVRSDRRKYLKPDGKPKHRGFYNLYCNKLLAAIPDGPGWYVFIDDDDKYTAPDVIERFVKGAKPKYINVARADRGGGRVWPKFWRKQMVFQTECFMLHTIHKDRSRWPKTKGGDHKYTKKLTKMLPINWIENLIVCKAQSGKHRGKRVDKK